MPPGTSPNQTIADINRSGFSTAKVGEWYARQHSGLDEYPEEKAALRWLLDEYGPVTDLLDLGVGAGRTTAPLKEITKNYIGVDFSPTMIDHCKKLYPGTEYRVGDARNLSGFKNSSFDLVFFSFNGIDYVDHRGRLLVLKTVRRVLRPKRFFIFSSHNRLIKPESIWRERPLWYLTHLPWMIPAELRHRKMRKLEVKTDEYEIRNDTGSGYRMMTYYIEPNAQIEQLQSAGFDSIEMFDHDGKHHQGISHHSTSPWLCYLCRKK